MNAEILVNVINNLHINVMMQNVSREMSIEVNDRVSKDEMVVFLQSPANSEEKLAALVNLFYRRLASGYKYKQLQHCFENDALVAEAIMTRVTKKLRENKVIVNILKQSFYKPPLLACEF